MFLLPPLVVVNDEHTYHEWMQSVPWRQVHIFSHSLSLRQLRMGKRKDKKKRHFPSTAYRIDLEIQACMHAAPQFLVLWINSLSSLTGAGSANAPPTEP